NFVFKKNYIKEIMRKAVKENDDGIPINEFFKKFTILDAMNTTCKAWNEVSTETIAKSWHNLIENSIWGTNDQNSEKENSLLQDHTFQELNDYVGYTLEDIQDLIREPLEGAPDSWE